MPRRNDIDHDAIAALLIPGRSVATHRELQSLGLPPSTITSRSRPGGPWQRLLPGVVAGHRGIPTTYEKRLAAVKYGGESAALTGLDALDELGIRVSEHGFDRRVHVLVPHTSQRTSHGFALVTRTRSAPATTLRRDLPRVSVARAVIDASRRASDLDPVRTLVARAVQQRRCTVAELAAEVRKAPRQRTALVRTALREVQAGVRSAAEAKVRVAFHQYGVPQPRWNADLRNEHGELVAVVDGLWERERVILEIDSIEWHLEPTDYKRTQARQRRLVLAGWTVFPAAPSDILDGPEQFCRQVIDVLSVERARRSPR